MVKRDHYYDLIKGMVAINVIFIHTVCWSGNDYVPDFLRNLSLLLDVPIFFFLSGACQHYVKNVKRQFFSFVKLYVNWVAFLPIYWLLVIFLRGSISGKDFLLNLLFVGGSESKALPVVMGSTWFWPVYFIVGFLGSIIVHKLKSNLSIVLKGSTLLYIILNVMWVVSPSGIIKQGLKIIFYLMMFLLGYRLHNIQISKKIFWVIEIISAGICVWYVFSIFGATGMLQLKAPPVIPYALYALMAVTAVVYFHKTIEKENILCWVGKNSLMFYFAQGISSSMIYGLVSYLDTNWVLKLVVCFIVNVFVAFLIVYLLNKYYFILNQITIKVKQYIFPVERKKHNE